jgi:hypothetical protein
MSETRYISHKPQSKLHQAVTCLILIRDVANSNLDNDAE